MKIRLHINSLRPTNETGLFVRQLQRMYGLGNVSVDARTGMELPRSVRTLLTLEQMLHRIPTNTNKSSSSGAESAQSSATDQADVVVDLRGDAPLAQNAKLSLKVLYDGVCDDRRIYAALLASRLPLIEIADVSSGRVLAAGTPCVDNAETLTQATQNIFARVATLVSTAIEQPRSLAPGKPVHVALPGVMRLAEIELRNLANAASRRLYRLCCHAPHWRIGWRFIDGPGVAEQRNLGGKPWRVLADPGNRFYADPMPIVVNGRTYIFFEDYPHSTKKGIISFVEVHADGSVGPVQPVLEESWHLSYPFLLQIGRDIFMVPESSSARDVAVYRADPFPHRWVRHGTLLSGIDLSDATIVEHNAKLWMFGTTRDGAGSPSDTLSIFSADRLEGSWTPHPQNPIVIDAVTARPAGPCIRQGNKLWRVTQDCRAGYGKAIGLVEVLQLDEHGYEQRLDCVIQPDAAWPGRRFHTLARAGNLECIDGSATAPKSRLVSRLMSQKWRGLPSIGAPAQVSSHGGSIVPSHLACED